MANLTFANQLTLFRLLLVPVLVILVIYDRSGWALVTFVTAGITDGLDGVIARRSGQLSDLGALLDPMADKLLLLSTFVVLTIPSLSLVNSLPIWLTVLVISRDVIIVLTVAVVNLAVGRFTFKPSFLGKIATCVYILTGSVTLFFNYLEQVSIFVDVAVWASLIITLVSGVHYIRHATRLVNQS
tara:strand:+ start:115 stop:669 length:555 start_codon:yes stop_codon:yes gene_type:complete